MRTDLVSVVHFPGIMLTRTIALLTLLAGCTPTIQSGDDKVSSTDDALTGCHGTASSSIPANDEYYLTSFGGRGESGTMACGESTRSGSWYYMASRQRFGCGAHVQLEANGKCVVAEADDYGPDVCVEHAAGRPIIDASPLVAEALYGVGSAGWSDRLGVVATVVADSTPLGPCRASSGSYTCSSATLGTDTPAASCVQSSADSNWYQCTPQGWVEISGPSASGPEGACTNTYPLN